MRRWSGPKLLLEYTIYLLAIYSLFMTRLRLGIRLFLRLLPELAPHLHQCRLPELRIRVCRRGFPLHELLLELADLAFVAA